MEAIGDGVLLTGNVASPAEAQMAFEIATRLLGVGTNPSTINGDKIVNAITVRGHDQVMIKITVAEMQRTVIKQLGIDLNGSFQAGPATFGLVNQNPLDHRSAAEHHQQPDRYVQVGDRHVARDGAGRRGSHLGRADPHRDLGRIRVLPGRRRVPDSAADASRPRVARLPSSSSTSASACPSPRWCCRKTASA